MPFLIIGSNQKTKNEHAEDHDIFVLFKTQIYSKQGSHLSFVRDKGLSNISHVWVQAKVSTVSKFQNSNLTNLPEIQRLHEIIEFTICVSNGVSTKNILVVPHLFMKLFYLNKM